MAAWVGRHLGRPARLRYFYMRARKRGSRYEAQDAGAGRAGFESGLYFNIKRTIYDFIHYFNLKF